jgi:nucleotide-binding universal stress UspA family protein
MNWLPKQTVIVPIDFSHKSLEAVGTALTLVKEPSGVHVVHVLPDTSPTDPGVAWSIVDKASRVRHVEQALAEQLSDDQYKGIETKVAFGDPGREITAYAEKAKADLIVIPSHGRTGLKRLLIGSVAERVVRLAHCPVLVLRS